MFQDNDLICVTSWEALERNSESWLQTHLQDHSYAGWLVEEGGQVIAGAGVWFMDWPPHHLHPEPIRAYLMNFYVTPDARGKGVAAELLDRAVAECDGRGVRTAVLHASKMGTPLYEHRGWFRSNEMMLRLG
jgi:GNAT superfamily N-acetyltransferase